MAEDEVKTRNVPTLAHAQRMARDAGDKKTYYNASMHRFGDRDPILWDKRSADTWNKMNERSPKRSSKRKARRR